MNDMASVIKIWLMVFFVAVLTGCSRQEAKTNDAKSQSGLSKQKSDLARAGKKAALGDDAVIICCGTNKFTMGEASKLVDLRVRMIKISSPNGQKISRNAAFDARVLASIPYGFPRDCALLAFASTNGIVVGESEIKLMRERAKQGAKQGFLSWSAFLRKFTDDERKTLEKRVRIEAVEEGVRKWHAKNRPAVVTDEELARYRERQREYNARAAATNAVIFATATNVWRDIVGGRIAFEEAVEKFSTEEGKSDDGEWGDFQLEYFNDDPVVRAAIESLQPGEFTAPIESDNGLAIIRLNERKSQDGDAPIYSLSRVFFHLPEFYPELDDVTFAAQIREARQNRLFNEFVKELVRGLPVTYPNGESIFENARRTASQPTLL